MKEKLNQRTEPLTFHPRTFGAHNINFPNKTMCKCATPKPQTIGYQHLNPKNHGNPWETPKKNPVAVRHEAASRNQGKAQSTNRTLNFSHYPKNTCANVQPKNTKQLITNTLTPKTMGTHGNPPVAIPHRPQKE